MGESVKSGAERRTALSVSRMIRVFYTVLCTLSVCLIGLITALGFVLSRFTVGVVPQETIPLFLTFGLIAFLLVGVALALGVYATVHTHRMVGAAYHIERTLSKLASEPTKPKESAPSRGPEAKVNLRPTDYLHGLATEVNALAERLGSANGVGSGTDV